MHRFKGAVKAELVEPCRIEGRDKGRDRQGGSARPESGRPELAQPESGQSLVEFAVALPVLLLIVTGICAFGIACNNYMILTDATNVGARQLAISRGQTTDPCATTANAVYAAAPNLKGSSLTFAFVLNSSSYSGASCSSGSTTTGAAANLTQGGTAKVTVTYPCSLAVYRANYAPTCLLTAQTAEVVQ